MLMGICILAQGKKQNVLLVRDSHQIVLDNFDGFLSCHSKIKLIGAIKFRIEG